jgi:hypothetical protein
MYAKFENNEIITTHNLRREFPNSSLPAILPDEFEGWSKVQHDPQGVFDVQAEIELVNGVFRQRYVFDAAKSNDYLSTYRDYRAEHYTYKGVLLRLTNPKAMTSLSTLYLLCLGNTNIPDEAVMAEWQEIEGDIQITAGDLRADGAGILGNYQKAWAVAKALKNKTFETIAELEAAFDALYAAT